MRIRKRILLIYYAVVRASVTMPEMQQASASLLLSAGYSPGIGITIDPGLPSTRASSTASTSSDGCDVELTVDLCEVEGGWSKMESYTFAKSSDVDFPVHVKMSVMALYSALDAQLTLLQRQLGRSPECFTVLYVTQTSRAQAYRIKY